MDVERLTLVRHTADMRRSAAPVLGSLCVLFLAVGCSDQGSDAADRNGSPDGGTGNSGGSAGGAFAGGAGVAGGGNGGNTSTGGSGASAGGSVASVGGSFGFGGSAGTGGAGAGGTSAGGTGAGGAPSCVPDRSYACDAPGDCPGMQRCSASGYPSSCICAPPCDGFRLGTIFDAEACRIAFTEDPSALGDGWEDAYTVSISEDDVWYPNEVIHRVEDQAACTGSSGWFVIGPRAIALCPVSCASVIAGDDYSAILGCPTVWRAQ